MKTQRLLSLAAGPGGSRTPCHMEGPAAVQALRDVVCFFCFVFFNPLCLPLWPLLPAPTATSTGLEQRGFTAELIHTGRTRCGSEAGPEAGPEVGEGQWTFVLRL